MIANIRLDKIIEDMKELYFFDETFYWGRSGKGNYGVGSPDHIQESDLSMLYYLSHSHFI